jgi:hypothetical protein
LYLFSSTPRWISFSQGLDTFCPRPNGGGPSIYIFSLSSERGNKRTGASYCRKWNRQFSPLSFLFFFLLPFFFRHPDKSSGAYYI